MSSAGIMRYGCNPHQTQASFYMRNEKMLPLEIRNGAPSYINLMDALNSWALVRELRQALNMPAAASFKHVSPAGAAVGVPLNENLSSSYFVNDLELTPLATAYARARGADRLASFGDWIALSDVVDLATAKIIQREVSDGIIAPGFEADAFELLKRKKGGKYPIFQMDKEFVPDENEIREVFGVTLKQTRNNFIPNQDFFKNVVSLRTELSKEAERDLTVATIAAKYTQSNSVTLAREGQIIGIGAGQQSRVHCVRLACSKADNWYLRQHPNVTSMQFKKNIKRAEKVNAIDIYLQEEATNNELAVWQKNFDKVPELISSKEKRQFLDKMSEVALSSDAFFPFRDNIDRASRSGVEYIVQAGGSVRDDDVIQAANEYNILMINSGVRLFHH